MQDVVGCLDKIYNLQILVDIQDLKAGYSTFFVRKQ